MNKLVPLFCGHPRKGPKHTSEICEMIVNSAKKKKEEKNTSDSSFNNRSFN